LPTQVSIVPGVHETAMHVPGSPEMTPSISQYGKAGSRHDPEEHALFSFFVVQPTSMATRPQSTPRM
jgi:hypothetical protein